MAKWKYLVVIEAPNKARTIASYLGPDYFVVATKGHCIDLPSNGINISIKKDKSSGFYTFKPNYEINKDKASIVKEIVDLSNQSQMVFLMTDADREGSAIAYHISNQLSKDINFKRASTNSITKSAINEAIKNAGPIDMDMVNSYEARRMLDRLVGYKCSFLTQTATGGKSVGRVQSSALRILAEREKEIIDFKPQEYWDITADLLSSSKDIIISDLKKPDKMEIDSKAKADKIVQDLTKGIAKVTKYDVKNVFANPYPPFTTSTIQQSAHTYLGMDPKKTMSVAQSLYASGLITYHRTDSTAIVPSRLSDIRNYISNNYASKYISAQPNIYKSTVKNAQEAHEAIMPTDINVAKAGASPEEAKLYDLIWKRTIACQMNKSESESISVRFSCKEYELGCNGSRLIFDGWKKVWNYSLSQDVILPLLKVGDELDIIKVNSEQKFTQPPPRFSGASLVKTLEQTGIGRPSTFASIIETLKDRSYIEEQKKVFKVTDLGLSVVSFLKSVNFCFIDLNFTANMENDLDDISNKLKLKENVLDLFYKQLLQDIDRAKTIKTTSQKTGHLCPNCGKDLLKKHSRFGPFYGCSDKDNCGTIMNIGDDGSPVAKKVVVKQYGKDPCPTCNGKMVLRNSKMGEFYGCESYFKGCRGMRDKNGAPIEPKKPTGKKFFKRKK